MVQERVLLLSWTLTPLWTIVASFTVLLLDDLGLPQRSMLAEFAAQNLLLLIIDLRDILIEGLKALSLNLFRLRLALRLK